MATVPKAPFRAQYTEPVAGTPEPAWWVARDVRNGFAPVEAAARDYGVVVDVATFEVDVAATERLRERV